MREPSKPRSKRKISCNFNQKVWRILSFKRKQSGTSPDRGDLNSAGMFFSKISPFLNSLSLAHLMVWRVSSSPEGARRPTQANHVQNANQEGDDRVNCSCNVRALVRRPTNRNERRPFRSDSNCP